ncbi:MAG: autotransporter-associated beta strand repeat-containing protein [Bacteroidaceae bacterium]|nr:autotransporter-associated beta strand repeat-containing protein [Bacteroidaceae bacterium]
MKKNYFWAVLLLLFSQAVMAQRFTDKLDRGLVVIPTGSTDGSTTNLITWRRLSEENYNVTYNLYKNGTLLKSGLTTTSYADNKNGLPTSTYQVEAVVNGVVKQDSTAVKAWSQYVYKLNNNRCATGYLDIALSPVYSRAGVDITDHYSPNDAEFADLDGDGQLEMIIKRLNTVDATGINTGVKDAKGNDIWYLYPINSTEFSVIDAYDINWQTGAATLLWRIDCGPNMVSHMSTEMNIIAYDWDEDGKAEVVLRGADNMIVYGSNGKTQLWTVGDMSVNTRVNWPTTRQKDGANLGGQQYTYSGAEYLIYMNGLTGAKYQMTDYPLKRLESGESDLNAAWGDGYGHRSSKYFFGAPFLDGRHASLFLGRGIYTRHKMMAMELNRKTHQWSELWTWNCNNSSSPWYGNGYHNYIIADVDEDGRDEIVYGSMVIDDNGKGLSTTGLGHGDAQHVSDFDPWRKGLEFFGCNEDKPAMNYRNATTSEIYVRRTASGDDGRGMMGNFSSVYPGCIGRSVNTNLISSVVDNEIIDSPTSDDSGLFWSHLNFRIYWDGDLGSEILDSPGTAKEAAVWDYENGRLFTSSDCNMNNGSKNNPCFQGDLIGDWREEIVVRCGTNVRVYTSGMGTNYSLPCLWYDHQYRQAMVWQMMAYNQPPHLSYFLGELEGYTVAPPPYSMQDRTEIANGGTISSSHNGKQIIACETNNMNISVEDGASPWVFYDNAPSWVQGTDVNGTSGSNPTINYAYYTHTVTGGAFTGNMNLVKQGDGTLVLPTVEQTYTGKTDIWAGTVEFNGSFSKSPVWMNRFTTFNTSGGAFNGGLTMEYASTLNVGGATAQSISNVTVSTLTLNYGARVVIDVNSTNDVTQNDQLTIGTLVINTKNWENGPQYSSPVLQINATKNLAGGRYPLGTVNSVTGDLSNWVIECSKAPADSYLELDGTTLYFVTGEAQMLKEPTLAITNMVKTDDIYYPTISISDENTGAETTKKFVFTDINGEETTFENVERVSYFSEDYSSNTISWNSRFSISDGTAYYKNGDSGGRNTYLDLSSYGAGNKYNLEFDAQMTIGYRNNTEVQNSQIAIYNSNATMPTRYVTDFLTANTLFSIQNSGTTTFVVDGTTSTSVQTKVWYHYLIEVDGTSVTYTITDTHGTEISSGSSTVANTTLGGIFIVNGRAGVMQFDNIKLYLPEELLGDSFTFTEPGTLKVVLEADGFENSESTFQVVEPYVIKYESPAYNEINAADANATLGSKYSATIDNNRSGWWNSGITYYNSQSSIDAGYIDSDKVLMSSKVSSTYCLKLIQGYGIGRASTGRTYTISASDLGDENTIIYYKAYIGYGNSDTFNEGFTNADENGYYAYTIYNSETFCKLIAYIPASAAIRKGDVNVDGDVTIADVVMMVNYILGSTDNAANVLKYGDMDDSGEVNISDVVSLVNIILGN